MCFYEQVKIAAFQGVFRNQVIIKMLLMLLQQLKCKKENMLVKEELLQFMICSVLQSIAKQLECVQQSSNSMVQMVKEVLKGK